MGCALQENTVGIEHEVHGWSMDGAGGASLEKTWSMVQGGQPPEIVLPPYVEGMDLAGSQDGENPGENDGMRSKKSPQGVPTPPLPANGR